MNDRQAGDSIAELQDVHDGLSLLNVLFAMAAVEELNPGGLLFVVVLIVLVVIVWMQWVIRIEEEITESHRHGVSPE